MSINAKDFLPKVEITRNDRGLIDLFIDGEKQTDINHIGIELDPQRLPVINYGKVQKDENGHIQIAIADGEKAIAVDQVSISVGSLKIDI